MVDRTLIWTDGTIVTGSSFRELEDTLRATQWSTYKTRREFRREMRRRAAIWSGRPKTKPVGIQSSQDFILSLVHAGMCTLVEDDGTTTTTVGSRS